MNGATGIIFDIQRFSIHDGPGIRTTIFLKGCGNCCLWCHNPESINNRPEMQYFSARCCNCGNCVLACPNKCHVFDEMAHSFERKGCNVCGLCTATCYNKALVISGRKVSVEDTMSEILADIEYYRESGGGVTLSGGEPVLQNGFCKEILLECKKAGLNTVIQTAGNYDFVMLRELLPYTDLVMYDVKAYSESIYDNYIHCDRDVIFDNLSKLSAENTPIIVRTPVISPINDSEREIVGIARHICNLRNIIRYELLPYHNLGEAKYDAFDMKKNGTLSAPSRERLSELKHSASKYVAV